MKKKIGTNINSMSLKAKIRNIARKNGISAQAVLQYYFFEHFLNRLSQSEYQNNFIIKGGFLITCITGLEQRSTMDIDVSMNKGSNIRKYKCSIIH